jgi:hypothetical protein
MVWHAQMAGGWGRAGARRATGSILFPARPCEFDGRTGSTAADFAPLPQAALAASFVGARICDHGRTAALLVPVAVAPNCRDDEPDRR